MPSSTDARRSLLGDSASESDSSVRSGILSATASCPSNCGGGAGCSGCVPRLAIRVSMGGGEADADDETDEDLDDRGPRRASGSGGSQQRRRRQVHGRAVLHANGGFSFRQDREGGGKVRRGVFFSLVPRSVSPSGSSSQAFFSTSLSKPTSRQARPPTTSNPFARCFSWLCGGGGGGGEDKKSSFSYEVEASDLVGALPLPSLSSSASSPSSSSPSSAFVPFSASRGRLPPLRPIPSSGSSSPREATGEATSTTTATTTEEIVSRIRAAAAPWDNQLPSDPPRPRSALVVINPAAGGGSGVSLFERLLSPMLEAAGVEVRGVVLTEKRGDAARAAAAADPSAVGALVAVGGDGTAAELLQGLMTRVEKGDSAEAARRMPLAVLPAGSGNALALSSSCCSAARSSSFSSARSSSSSPPYPAASVCATRAAAAIARGRSAPLDVVVADSSWEGEGGKGEEKEKRGKPSQSSSFRFATDGALLLPSSTSSPSSPSALIARRFAFLSLTYGLIANADVGTDPWRWMGPLRFTLGALREVAARRSHGLEAFVVDSGCDAGSGAAPSSASSPSRPGFPGALPTPLLDSLPASALLPRGGGGGGGGDTEGPRSPSPWRRLASDDAALFACCNLPRLDASTHLAPGARRDCGSLHLVRTRGGVPRLAALRLLSQVESGSHVPSGSNPSSSPRSNDDGSEKNKNVVAVDRVRALLLRPLDASRHGRLALDGEELPRGRPVACEVVPGGARLIVAEF